MLVPLSSTSSLAGFQVSHPIIRDGSGEDSQLPRHSDLAAAVPSTERRRSVCIPTRTDEVPPRGAFFAATATTTTTPLIAGPRQWSTPPISHKPTSLSSRALRPHSRPSSTCGVPSEHILTPGHTSATSSDRGSILRIAPGLTQHALASEAPVSRNPIATLHAIVHVNLHTAVLDARRHVPTTAYCTSPSETHHCDVDSQPPPPPQATMRPDNPAPPGIQI
ncbi:hypothetical protein DAEQUDRAFT_558062 [Daedalea quercina L-15889]|uniref:Uncharacterized protein n=1 Tax=Daedalea quercina L-15889 TaxID=1314783 RepID=A0A165M1Y3_9APHY|nr:hypothetical protein DAEQUDRAFT_558062 [Daedalea quercina L-15889]